MLVEGGCKQLYNIFREYVNYIIGPRTRVMNSFAKMVRVEYQAHEIYLPQYPT